MILFSFSYANGFPVPSSSLAGTPALVFFCFRLLRRKNTKPAIMAARAMTPMTIPAIAPPDMLEDFGEEEEEPMEAAGVAEEFGEDVIVLALAPVDMAVEDEDKVEVVGEAWCAS